jgi:hypothetical protein
MTSDTAEAVVDAAALWTSVARGRAGTSTAAIGTTAVDVSSDVDLASDACLACVDTPPVVVVVVVDINLLWVLLRTMVVVVLPKLLRHQNLVLTSQNHHLADLIIQNLHLTIIRNPALSIRNLHLTIIRNLALSIRNLHLTIIRNLALGITRNLRFGMNPGRDLDMVEDIIVTSSTDRPATAGPGGMVTAEVLRPTTALEHLALGVDHHHHHLAILDTVSQFIAGLVVPATLMAAHLAIPSRSLTTLMAGGRKQ